jgi:hypothetical protein
VPDCEHVQDALAESKTAHFSPFFTFLQLRSWGYAPSKSQKLTKNTPVFTIGRESRTCSESCSPACDQSHKGRISDREPI